MAIKRTKERIDRTGEIFTPVELVKEILNRLPKNVFSKSDKTFCDPACGDGNFLVEILKRKLKNGHHPSEALSTLYGVDIMEDNVKECRKRLLKIVMDSSIDLKLKQKYLDIVKKNIVKANALTYDFLFSSK